MWTLVLTKTRYFPQVDWKYQQSSTHGYRIREAVGELGQAINFTLTMFHFKNGTCGEYWVLDIGTNKLDGELTSLIVFNCFSAVLTVTINSVCLIALWHLKTLQDGTRVILLNLCVADLLTGTVSQPLYIIFVGLQKFGFTQCLMASILTSVNFGFSSASFFMLIAASAERYFSVFYPFKYELFINGWQPRFVIVAVWMNAILTSSFYGIVGLKKQVVITAVLSSCIGCILVGLMHAKILYFAFNVRRLVRDHTQARRLTRNSQHYFKSLTGFLVTVSVICYSPYFISMYHDFVSVNETSQIVVNWLWSLILANSFVNPVCYFVKNTKIRKGVIRLIKIQDVVGEYDLVNV